jgi:hypothetical protein
MKLQGFRISALSLLIFLAACATSNRQEVRDAQRADVVNAGVIGGGLGAAAGCVAGLLAGKSCASGATAGAVIGGTAGVAVGVNTANKRAALDERESQLQAERSQAMAERDSVVAKLDERDRLIAESSAALGDLKRSHARSASAKKQALNLKQHVTSLLASARLDLKKFSKEKTKLERQMQLAQASSAKPSARNAQSIQELNERRETMVLALKQLGSQEGHLVAQQKDINNILNS